MAKNKNRLEIEAVLGVEVIGFEPTAPSLRTKCSAELSYTPQKLLCGRVKRHLGELRK